MINVTLVNYTPEPEKMVAMSANLCYNPLNATEIADNLTPERIKELVNRMIDSGHLSTVEHVSFTFAVEGISRACSHQLVRHRIASYSQQSQRFIKSSGFEYITPPSIKAKEKLNKKYDDAIENLRRVYDEFLKAGIKAEDARFLMPNAAETKIVITMNARSLMNFFQERCCSRAQWEIREMANKMLVECKKVAPTLFAKAGPTCITGGYCREGEHSCGLLEKLKEKKQ